MKIYIFIISFCFLLNACQKPETSNTYDIGIDSGWEFKQGSDSIWHSAIIPGNFRSDLIFNNLLDSSLSDVQIKQYQTYTEGSWEYRNIFDIPAEVIAQDSVYLKLEGIAGNADVYLNGQYLLKSRNMFKTWLIPCKLKLKEYQNVLLIRFKANAPKEKFKSGISDDFRKAAFLNGSEINSAIPFLGIWKPVKIIAWSRAIISGSYFETDTFSDRQADVIAHVDIESSVVGDYFISFDINGNSTEKFKATLQKGKQSIKFKISIDNPKLWWCNGMGKPAMYESIIHLWDDSKIISEKSTRFGIRKIKLINEADSIGYNFHFQLNEKPVFCKGSVFIPPDITNLSGNAAKYEQIISDAASANLNFLRVWGGGIYENDLFYELCDNYGIMVWQDFPFSINSLTDQEVVRYNIQEEIQENGCRLRNHPSLVGYYCGLNLSSNTGYILEKLSLKIPDNKGLHNSFIAEKLPELIGNICKLPVFIDSGFNQVAADYKPVVRDWRVWYDAAPFSTYFDNPGNFIIEYGMQSFPDNKTLTFEIQENSWNIIPDDARFYQFCSLPWIGKTTNGNQLILDYIRMYYNEPVNYASFVYLSQILQANALKCAIEAHRIRKPFCMGSVFWHFNDCQPAISWSVSDYYNRLKPAYYAVKNAFKNVLVVPERLNGDIRIWAVNDSLSSFSGECNVSLVDFNGRVWFSKIIPVNIPAEQTQILWLVNETNVIKSNNSNKRMLVVSLKSNDRLVDENILYFSDPLFLDLPVPDITYTIEPEGNKFKLFLTSDRLAKNVVLSSDSLEMSFSDNNLDMLPTRTYAITIDFSGNMEDLKENLKIVSLIDSY